MKRLWTPCVWTIGVWTVGVSTCAVLAWLPVRGDAAPQTFDEFVVVGEVLKPEIIVVISRENLNKAYDLQLDESFLDKIIESVRHAPF